MPGAVARVLPDVAAVDRPFDYSVPEGWDLEVGSRVRVNLHGRSVRGWVVELAESSEVETLKPIAKRLGAGPPPDIVALCEWAAWRWDGPWSRLLASASPTRIVHERMRPPAQAALPELPNALRVFGRRQVRDRASVLVRVGPCTDPLDLVLSVLDGIRESAIPGSLVVTTPTTGWAHRFADRLRRRGLQVADPDHWAEAASGWPVVVAARAGALAPVPVLAGAVVLDAHDDAYRQTQTPCWDAVTVLAERCRRARVPMIATSWCASPTLRGMADREVALEHEARLWPKVAIADLSVADPRERFLSAAFVDAAHRALDADRSGVRVAVVLQRLGGARRLACKQCGALAVCEAHRAPLEERDGAYGCADGCSGLPRLCISCGSQKLSVLREGITTLTRRTSALLGVEAVEVSASAPAIPEDARVVVGTEAVLSRVRRAGLVCFADLDDYLCAPRAHGGLEALRAIGLAGRIVGARSAQDPGLVLVQTRMPADPVIEAAVNGSPGPLIAAESERAAQLGLPPNVATCALEGAGAAAYAEALGRAGLVVTEEAGRMVATAHDHVILCDALRSTPRPAASVRVVVDPVG